MIEDLFLRYIGFCMGFNEKFYIIFFKEYKPLRPGFDPRTGSSGKAGSCLPLVGSLQYTTLANSMYWFPLPFQLHSKFI